MNMFTRSPGASIIIIGIVGILLPCDTFAQYRVAVEPSVEMTGVHDDNLFYTDARPASDFIQRVRPSLELRFESPRWSVSGNCGFDSERYANHSALTNSQARKRASMNVTHRVSPRLEIALAGGYTNTDNPADLNLETGLADARTRVRRLNFGPSGRLQISPLISAHAASLTTADELSDGRAMRASVQTAGVQRRVSPRDLLTADYEQSFYSFEDNRTTSRTNSYVLRAGWTRSLDSRTQVTLQLGPRVSDGSPAPEFSASLSRRWRRTSIVVSGQQTETTAVGHIGTLQTRNLSALVTYEPFRTLTAYASPSVHRSSQSELEVTVYRIGLGARYAATPMMSVDVSYSRDLQRGILDRARPAGDLLHNVLLVGVSTRWSERDGRGVRLR